MADNVVQFVLKMQAQGFTGPAREASKATSDLATSSKNLQAGAGKAAESASRLASGLALVSPAAATATSEFAKAAGVVRSVGEAGEAAGLSMGVLGPIMAGIVAVAGSAYLAWKTLHEEEERDEAITKTLRDGREKLTSLFKAQAAAQVDLRVATGELTSAEGEALKARMGAQTQLQAALKGTQERISELHAGEGSFGRLIGDVAEFADAALGGWNPVAKAVGAFTTSTREANAEIGKLSAGQQQLAADGKMAVETIAAGTLARKKDAPAIRAQADAMRDYAAALSEGAAADATAKWWAANVAAASEARRQLVDLRMANSEMVTARLDGVARVNAAEQDALRANAVAEVRALDAFKGTEEQRLALIKGYEERATIISQAAADERARAAVEAQRQAIQSVQAWGSSPVSSLANMPGPVGWVFSLLQMFSNFKQTLSGINSFEKGIEDSLATGGEALSKQFLRSIEHGTGFIKAAPQFVQGFVDGLPSVVKGLAGQIGPVTSALIEGLVVGAPRLVGSILGGLLDPNTWIEIGRALWDGFVKGFSSLGSSIESGAQSVASWFDGGAARRTAAYTSGHRSGADYIGTDGWRFVHAGERIDTASKVSRESGGGGSSGGAGRVRMGGRAGMLTFEIDANTFASQYRDLQRRGLI